MSEERHMRPMHGDDFDPENLDPGIRDLVMQLIAMGYRTTDSGDGVSKPAGEEVLPFRHVVIDYHGCECGIDHDARQLESELRADYPNVAVATLLDTDDRTGDVISLLIVLPDGEVDLWEPDSWK